MILSQAKPGQEAAFIRWYKDQHLVDVARLPGVVSARLFQPDLQKVYDVEVPTYTLMTMYELETDDPAAAMEAIKALAGTDRMPMTDALDKTGMIQVIATQIASA
jgi:hypothetical protein